MLAIASCQNSEAYVPNEAPEGAQVYFPSTTVTSYTVDQTMTKIDLTLARIADEAEGNYGLEIVDTTKNHIFFEADYVAGVDFLAGQKEAVITIPVDYSKLQAGLKYALVFNVLEDTTPYGQNSIKVVLNVPEPWHYLGEAIFSEDVLTTFFNVTLGEQWTVPCYTNDLYPGTYFFKNAFTSLYPFNDPGDYVEDDVYFQVVVKENGDAYVPMQKLGFDWGYGEFGLSSYISDYFEVETDSYGKLENSIIRFEPKTVLISMADYKDGNWYFSNESGKFFIALPGAVLTDYTTSVSYGGMVVDPKGNCSLVVNFAGAEDVASIKYGLSATAEAEDILAAVLAGEGEGIVLGEVELGANGLASATISDIEPALYTVVAVPCNAAGVPQAADAVSAKVKFSGLGTSEFEPKLGVYTATDGTNERTLTFLVNPDDPTDYLVQNPSGLPDGSVWHLTLDETAKTLTCEGIEFGYEEYENQFSFGMVYGWYNKAQLYAYGYVSFLESSSEDGDAPLIFNLDDDGYVIGIQNVYFGAFVYQADAQGVAQTPLGWGYRITNDSEFTYQGAAVSSTAKTVFDGGKTSKKVKSNVENPVFMK